MARVKGGSRRESALISALCSRECESFATANTADAVLTDCRHSRQCRQAKSNCGQKFLRVNSRRSGMSAGARLRAALAAERPLQVVGVIQTPMPRCSRKRAGFRPLYLSGSGGRGRPGGPAGFGCHHAGRRDAADVRRITRATPPRLARGCRRTWLGRPTRSPCEKNDPGGRGRDSR